MQKKMFVVETEHPCQGISAVSKHMPSYQKLTNWSMQSLGMLLKLWQVILICSGWSYSLAANSNTLIHGAHVQNLIWRCAHFLICLNIIFFFFLLLPFRSYRKYVHVSQKTKQINLPWFSNSKSFHPLGLNAYFSFRSISECLNLL